MFLQNTATKIISANKIACWFCLEGVAVWFKRFAYLRQFLQSVAAKTKQTVWRALALATNLFIEMSLVAFSVFNAQRELLPVQNKHVSFYYRLSKKSMQVCFTAQTIVFLHIKTQKHL